MNIKKYLFLSALILVSLPSPAHAVTITINSVSRQLVAAASGSSNGTNYTTTNLGTLHTCFRDSTVSDPGIVYPGSPTDSFAEVDQDSRICFSNETLSISGSGDANAQSIFLGYQEWAQAYAVSQVVVTFTVDNPYPYQQLYYSASASLSPSGYFGVIDLSQKNEFSFWDPIFAFSDYYGFTTNAGTSSGMLSSPVNSAPYPNGTYMFNATVSANGEDTNTFAPQYSHFDFKFTLSPVPPLSIAAAGGVVSLLWPASATSAILESTTNLSDPTSWSTVTNTVDVVDNQFVVAVDPTQQPGAFFRLKVPQL